MATKPTVYIETSIAGHLTSRVPRDPIVAGRMLETRNWWKDERDGFECFTSEIVLIEAAAGDPQAAADRLSVLTGLPLVTISPAVFDLSRQLLTRHALPAKANVDASHVAAAAINGIEFLLTWNCRHLANANLRTRIMDTCKVFGFEPPIICTPSELKEKWP